MTATSPAVPTPHPSVQVIHAAGVLDTPAVARLLRLIDARLALVDQGHSVIRHIVIDLGTTRTADTTALTLLDPTATHPHVRLHLAGTGHLTANLPLAAHRHLSRFSTYPTVEAALHALTTPDLNHHDHGSP